MGALDIRAISLQYQNCHVYLDPTEGIWFYEANIGRTYQT